MTESMLALAECNRAEVGVENVRFLKGIIEDIPLPAWEVHPAIIHKPCPGCVYFIDISLPWERAGKSTLIGFLLRLSFFPPTR